ncbi:hypothetical protein [Actinokineospora sp. HUAS TT18]|uniref:hypothetical protein n=1 Tax=Actinokineospora sp. HUAS TT18 TaxID=3447451 RepID=UPI003F51E409
MFDFLRAGFRAGADARRGVSTLSGQLASRFNIEIDPKNNTAAQHVPADVASAKPRVPPMAVHVSHQTGMAPEVATNSPAPLINDARLNVTPMPSGLFGVQRIDFVMFLLP